MSSVFTAAGCGAADPVVVNSPEGDAFVHLVDMQIRDAQAAHAAESQIEVLESARESGVMTHEAALGSFNEFVDCLTAAGIKGDLQPDSRGGDFPPIRFVFYADDPTIADACNIKYFDFVDTVYQVQPAAQQAETDTLEANREAIVACLEEHGVTAEHVGTTQELTDEVLALFFGYLVEDPDTKRPGGEFDCLGSVGLTPADI